jgi:hypothetical protein
VIESLHCHVTRWVQSLHTYERLGLVALRMKSFLGRAEHLQDKVHLKREAMDCDYLVTLGACCSNAYGDALVQDDQRLH